MNAFNFLDAIYFPGHTVAQVYSCHLCKITIAPGLVDKFVGRRIGKSEVRTHLDHRQAEGFNLCIMVIKIDLMRIFSVVNWL